MKNKKKPAREHSPKRDAKDKQIHAAQSHVKLFVAVIAVCIGIGLIGWAVWFYSNRALPNVTVGNVTVGSQSPQAIRDVIRKQAPALSITFDDNGKKTTIPAKDLGVVVDVEATLQNALHARRGNDLLKDVQIWQSVEIPLVLANDPGVLIEYAKQHFPSAFVDAKEPQIVWNDASAQFEVKPGEPGKGMDIKSFERALPGLAAHPKGFTLKLTTQPVEPLLDQAKAEKVAVEATQHAKQLVEFKRDDKVIYTAKPSEIAGWIGFTPDPAAGTFQIVVDKAKVNQFISSTVGPTVAAPPVDRKVVVDSASGAQVVIQQGRAGSQIQDVDALSGDVVGALNGNRTFSQGVSIASAPFKTVTMKGGSKWVEVDIGSQTATLWMGSEKVKSFLISSGKAHTPTELGEFAIYSKTPSMTMTGTIAGDFFYLPNVRWVSFFDGGEAFHGTYWHHNFGHPMSHGCINMTEADAKTLYDFAPIGTKVVVHA